MNARLRRFFGICEDGESMAKETTVNDSCLLSDNERHQAKEAKERTQRLLSDALKKKERVLLEDLKVFGKLKLKNHYPLITTDLVEELSRELEKVTFAKNKLPEEDIGVNAYVYPGSEDRTIYLCAPFWKMDPESKSQERTIIHEVSHFLGYGHTVQENSDRVQTSPQSMLCPQTAFSVASALTSDMDHRGTYTDGSYSCCGETSRDTVCEKSWVGDLIRIFEDEKSKAKKDKVRTMNHSCLLSDNEGKLAKEAKERTQRLLSDALKKKESLLVEDLKVFGDLNLETFHSPFITADLVEELIQELEKVKFAKNKSPRNDILLNAYVYPGSEDRTIYLCAPFWKIDPGSKSQQRTIIHEVSHFLGYGHTVQENSDRVQTSPQSMLCPQTADSVASALTSSMDHQGTYTDGSYSCCGETSRDTVCEESWVGDYIRLMRRLDWWRHISSGQK